MSQRPSRADIEIAWPRIRPYVRITPVIEVDPKDFGVEVGSLHLKLELLQHTGSFKPRGAFHRILTGDVPAVGVLAASGGNHGLAVAFAARALGHDAEIFVPESVPEIKLARLRAYGATVRQVGAVYDDAREASEQRAAESGALVVHAYDQPAVVCGAGTVGREVDAQLPQGFDSALIAVGGGGLIGGVCSWSRGVWRVVAVEPAACPTLNSARAAGHPVAVSVGGLASDSLAARQIGNIAFDCTTEWVEESVLVSDEAIARAQQLLWDRLRLIVEPGGATALAALLDGAYAAQSDERLLVMVCGANTDPARLVA